MTNMERISLTECREEATHDPITMNMTDASKVPDITVGPDGSGGDEAGGGRAFVVFIMWLQGSGCSRSL